MTDAIIGIVAYLSGLGTSYLLLAVVATALAAYLSNDRRRKVFTVGVVLFSFSILPAYDWLKRRDAELARKSYEAEAWATFRKLCAEQAGEKIYKRYPGVKSVLVTKPLPAATESDLFNQYWYGDPYSNATPWSQRGIHNAARLTYASSSPDGSRHGLEFVEVQIPNSGDKRFLRIRKPDPVTKENVVEPIEKPTSRFAVEWHDTSTPELRFYWIASSKLRVLDLSDSSIVAERVGFLLEPGFGSRGAQRRPWLTGRGKETTCPPVSSGGFSDNWFVGAIFPKGAD